MAIRKFYLSESCRNIIRNSFSIKLLGNLQEQTLTSLNDVCRERCFLSLIGTELIYRLINISSSIHSGLIKGLLIRLTAESVVYSA